MARILVIDDDPVLCRMLEKQIQRLGHDVESAVSLAEGIEKVRKRGPDVVLLDVNLPDGSGLSAIPVLRDLPDSPEIIIVTGYGDPDGAELAISSGAWDYIQKPLSYNNLDLQLSRTLQFREERKRRTRASIRTSGIIGDSPGIRGCLDLLTQAAGSEAGVLITGETGTGKELFARAIHENSRRSDHAFIPVDCASLPETLLTSTLFGHVKGAFTGATKSHVGLVAQANKGTLFLDEVGELPPSLQKSFLRVLQERKFRPVGAEKEMESNFRVVAATNKNLDDLARAGDFREDLLFRLKILTIGLPPLRERSRDIRAITLHHVNRLAEEYSGSHKGISQEFFQVLETHDWPGNVRELLNVLERAFTASGEEPVLLVQHLPVSLRVHAARKSMEKEEKTLLGPDSEAVSQAVSWNSFRETAIPRLEKGYLQNLIQASGNNASKAIEISGLSRSRLYHLLKKYSLKFNG